MTEIERASGAVAPVPVAGVDDSSRYDADKPPQQIEADIARTRDRVGSTLDALERKLSPRRLIAESTDSLLDAVGRDPDKIWAQLRANAIPLGLIAAGLAWLVFARQESRSGTPDYGEDGHAEMVETPLPLAAPSPIAADETIAPLDARSGVDTPLGDAVAALEPIDPVPTAGAGSYRDAAAEMAAERGYVDPAVAADKPAAPAEPPLMPEHSRKGE